MSNQLTRTRSRRNRVPALDFLSGMPGLGGHDVARSVREEGWGADVLLIAASGWGQADDKQRSEEAGFDHHLVKPVEFDVLDTLLRDRSRS